MAMPVAVTTMPAAATDDDARAAVIVVVAAAVTIIVPISAVRPIAVIRSRYADSDADAANTDVHAERHSRRCGGEHGRRRDCERKFLHRQLSSGFVFSLREGNAPAARHVPWRPWQRPQQCRGSR